MSISDDNTNVFQSQKVIFVITGNFDTIKTAAHKYIPGNYYLYQ